MSSPSPPSGRRSKEMVADSAFLRPFLLYKPDCAIDS
jgi:hypothetical protein